MEMIDTALPHVLVVDDNSAKRYVIAQILRTGGYRITEATCGEDALSALAEQRPDVIVLDVELPDISGFEVCRRIKTTPATSHIPVLHISGKFLSGEDRADGLEGGADGYLTEPVEPREVRAAVAALLRVRKAEAELTRANKALQDEIAERKRAEGELQAQQAFLRKIIDLNPNLIFAKDAQGRYTLANQAFANVYGMTVDELIGMTDANLNTDAVEASQFQADDREVLRNLQQKRVEDKTILDITGATRRFQIIKQPLIDPDGQARQVLAVANDVTELKQVECALRQAIEEAEAANRSKSEFLANMSHEIRTPMTAILGYTDMLLAPNKPDGERMEHLATIRRQGEHLLNILNDILDLSKIEAGRLTVEHVDCAPSRVIAEVMSLMRVRAEEKKIRLGVSYAGPVPLTIKTDPTRLRQILINLLGNAIKFTEAGGVQMVVRTDQDSQSPTARLRVEVIDSGIGMSPDQMELLFQPFSQADTSTVRRFGGSGLGLTISKRLAQRLGGDITCQSRPGRGSRFTLLIEAGDLDDVAMEFDMPDVVGVTPRKVAEPPLQLHARVLLAEDSVHNQHIISFYSRQGGVDVTIAENGRIACDKALEASAQGQPFDAILMDMQMPEMDGYSAATYLRNKGYAGPIIALTAHAMAHDRQKCLDAGCSDYLCKPVEQTQLLSAIAAAMEQAASSDTGPATGIDSEATFAVAPVEHHSEIDEVIKGFLPLFLNELPAQVEQLQSALDAQDLSSLAEVVHQLKGTGGIYGYMNLTQAASNVEQLLEKHDLKAVAVEAASLIRLAKSIGNDPLEENRAVENNTQPE